MFALDTDALADAYLATIGPTRARAETVRTVARALLDGRVDFRPERTLEDFSARWVALPGIGPWTAQYIAMRAMGHPDAFPAEGLVLQQAAPHDGSRLGARTLTAQAEAWRPWRAVGAADGRNPLPIALPCDRVIGADGSSTGFGGGLPTKQFLLVLEGALPRTGVDLFG